jgi:undecaprenyl-diphosphatase
MNFFSEIDERLFINLNSSNNNFSDFIFWWSSNKFIWIPLYIIFFLLVIKQYGRKSIMIFLLIALAILASDQLSVIIKEYFQRLRPCHNLNLRNTVHIVNEYCGGQYGFVSSHASNSISVGIILIYLLRKNWINITVIAWILLVSYSRIAIGVHYPGDILGGWLLGGIITLPLILIIKRYLKKNELDK